jgi:hypothetical protein
MPQIQEIPPLGGKGLTYILIATACWASLPILAKLCCRMGFHPIPLLFSRFAVTGIRPLRTKPAS